MRITIVGEDRLLGTILPARLCQEGYGVTGCATVAELTTGLRARDADLLIVWTDGLAPPEVLALCRRVRAEGETLLLLISHERDRPERTRALEAGADQYVLKPADADELIAHVHALVRRYPAAERGRSGRWVLVTEALWLDRPGQRLVGDADASPVSLTQTEFRLLSHLVRNAGTALDREALLNAVWGSGYAGATKEVDLYVYYLRRKLEPSPSRPRYLLTVWGKGYVYQLPAGTERESA